ncbi:MAG: hypothetical protein HY749_14520 [Gammaproteobacteria bacterium]|nr:hypothetical protein [Gammaproteobacteria bacterium]
MLAQNKASELSFLLSHDRGLSAVRDFDSKTYEDVVRQITELSNRKTVTPDDIGAVLRANLVPLTRKAIKLTSNRAIIDVTRAKLAQLEEISRNSMGDCAQLVLGQVDSKLIERVNSYTTDKTRRAVADATIQIVMQATESSHTPEADSERLRDTANAIREILLGEGLNPDISEAAAKGQPPDIICKSTVRLYQEALKMPAMDAAAFFRATYTD